jgi:hypothetical protein
MKKIVIIIITLLCFSGCIDRNNDKDFTAFENAPVTIISEIVINDSVINLDNVQAVIDPLWYNVDIYQTKDIYEESLKSFTSNQRYVFAIQWYMAEVNNGGHAQFFTNSTGIVWKDALEGFEKIGLEDYHLILKRAVEKFPGKPSYDRDEREAQFDKMGFGFQSFDDEFYDQDKKTPLEELLIAFIKKNRKDFYFKGKVSQPFLPSSNN